MATADFLDQTRHEIGARLNELKPLVDEYKRLEAAAVALDGVTGPPAASAPRSTRRAPARAGASTRARGAARGRGRGRGRGRPKGSGKRGGEALALVQAHPGITIAELADKMGMRKNYLYRLLPGLVDEGLVVKDGRGWRPR
jgi:hypothetical protein